MKRPERFEPGLLAATRLSRLAPESIKAKGILWLAWLSLCWLSIMALVTSCVVADPPEYTVPVQTRPELSAYSAKPSIYQAVVIPISPPPSPSFTVPVRSEDAGEQLLANFFLDYGTPNARYISGQFIAPSTYDDTNDRLINFVWQSVNMQETGCHTLTIVVAHVSSFPRDAQQLDPKKGDTDAAIITWWVNVNPLADALNTLPGCPSQSAVP